MNLNKRIRKKIVETKNQKDRLLIEQEILKSRIIMIFGNESNLKNFQSLPESKKIKYSFQVLKELSLQEENGFLNEGLTDIIKALFGTTIGGGFGQAILEPALNYILGGLGMKDTFLKKFVISFLTDKEGFWNAFKDCKTLTTAIAESIIEAFVMKGQQSIGKGSFWMDAIRNMLGDGATKIAMVQSLENQLSNKVCEFFGKATENATKVLDKVNG
jgi:hypothetical protein